MILVIDIGNTNTVFALFSPNSNFPEFSKRIVTKKDRTSDELGLLFINLLREMGVEKKQITGGIYSSVVPNLNPILERMLLEWFLITPITVNYQIRLPFEIKYPRKFEIGADRLVNTTAVVERIHKKAIIIDLGTATTFCVINDRKEYIGGVIAPGLKISMEALTSHTAQLPPIVFQQTEKILGESTVEAIQAGFFYGWIGLLKEIIYQIKKEHGEDFYIIGTGGLVNTIHSSVSTIFDEVDVHLTIKGLKILYDLNK